MVGDIQERFAEEKAKCQRKVRYISEAAAADAAYTKRMEFGKHFRTYQCVWCEGFHLATANEN